MFMVENLENVDHQKKSTLQVLLLTGDNYYKAFFSGRGKRDHFWVHSIALSRCMSPVPLDWRFRSFPFFSINHVAMKIFVYFISSG